MSETYKLAFIGEPGAGKTTCVAALSDIAPVATEVPATGELALLKDTTTVAFDYGEMNLDDGDRLLLYGLPGQARFSFMFDVVRRGLLGVIVLVDASSPRPMEGFRETIETYAKDLQGLPWLVAVNKARDGADALRRECQEQLVRARLIAPIVTVDARKRESIVRMFEILFTMLEYGTTTQSRQELVA